MSVTVLEAFASQQAEGLNNEAMSVVASENRFYVRVDLYRDQVSAPMTLFVDEYRKGPVASGR
jgi:hypothetical protein